ncbi:permeability factor 2-like [Centroberyx affinis]|uniref:permeability factor 2-like n=1 Tax=Centroberyx affinis TaxID=166261 RepID=UPI003A5C3014
MNTAIPSVVLLVCIAVCTSEGKSLPVLRCRCAQVTKVLNRNTIARIATAVKIAPVPYCSKTEVIATLKDGSSLCLDPDDNTTKTILKVIKITKQKRSITMASTSSTVVENTTSSSSPTTPN